MKPLFARAGAASAILIAITSTLFCWQEGAMVGQPSPEKSVPELVSATHCIGCHGEKGSKAYEQYKSLGITDFIRLDEHEVWSTQDLHSLAYRNIVPVPPKNKGETGNLAWRMQAVLQQDPQRGRDYKVTESAECLACHAVDRKPGPVARAPGAADRFHTKQGVSCESCHGFAEKWVGEHFRDSWRLKPPSEKQFFGLAKDGKDPHPGYGLVDLRSPRIRAEKCASCHVGNKDEGKFVSHEMYAAGHPPLPAFELASYSMQAPAHFHHPSKNQRLKQYAKADKVFAWRQFHFRAPEEEVADARNVSVGAVVAFRASMDLLAKEAANLKEGQLLDFAHFDCMACHHDLKHPSDRQNRGSGVPGRPLPKFQTELLEAVLEHAKSDGDNPANLSSNCADLLKKVANLRKGFDDRPFGDSKEILKAATELSKICNEVLAGLDATVYSPERARELANAIAMQVRRYGRKGDSEKPLYLDHDSAQQLAWALLVLRGDLHPPLPDAEVKETESLAKARDKLADTLVLYLRPGHRDKGGDIVFPAFPKSEEAIQEQRSEILKKRLEAQFRNYQSERFVTAMEEWLKLNEQKKEP